MTVQPRGARNRGSGRRPGWLLQTALLVLAILASATLVFTTRVELLRLAVILSLWAAVLAAFVSVMYRRQSETDQARARDMKFVYDLQLDREITARREYELNVEAQLRRQLSREIRAQSADELAGLRAEVAALRSNLEVMLGTDLGVRPALEAERVSIPMPPPPGRVYSSRVHPVVPESVTSTMVITESAVVETAVVESAVIESSVVETAVRESAVVESAVVESVVVETADFESAVENPIIDVAEEPLVPPAPQREVPLPQGPGHRGSHRRPGDAGRQAAPPVRPGPPQAPQPSAPWRPPETSRGRHRTGEHGQPVPPDPANGRHRVEAERAAAAAAANAGRHRPADEQAQAEQQDSGPQGQHAGGQSFADLMTKLQVRGPMGGGGRRRRED